jgi:hypothetical protein
MLGRRERRSKLRPESAARARIGGGSMMLQLGHEAVTSKETGSSIGGHNGS